MSCICLPPQLGNEFPNPDCLALRHMYSFAYTVTREEIENAQNR